MEHKLTPTERVIGIALLTILGLAMMSGLVSCDTQPKKYEIEYTLGRWMLSDKTDTFEIKDNSIIYIDENGNKVTRFGTFAVKQKQK